ncbi:MAG: hypothetical protein JNM25_03885 [Planctomycetes bacterium]|nr:hypothetical protein [Planctomycetota bacterium]
MTMLTRSLLALSLGLLTTAATAQCSTLAITGTGLPGTTLQVDLTGSTANAIAFVVIGETQGSTTISLGSAGSLVLGLDAPFFPVPLGMASATGAVSRGFAVPSTATVGVDGFGQGLSLSFTFSMPTGGGMPTFGFSTCTSNVVPFHFGA